MSNGYIGGSLNPNGFKTKENHPDFRGDLTIDLELLNHLNDLHRLGKDLQFDLAAWKKVGKGNKAYLSLKASPDRRNAAMAGAPARPVATPKTPDFDDDCPF